MIVDQTFVDQTLFKYITLPNELGLCVSPSWFTIVLVAFLGSLLGYLIYKR